MKPSESGTMNRSDWKNWGKNVLIFSTPALILFLGALANNTPFQDAAKVLYLAIINALIDLLRKYQAGK